MDTSETNIKILKPLVSCNSWSYIVNENGNAVRLTLEGYGSCTPVDALQEFIDNLTPDQFIGLWNECEQKKEIID